MGDNQSEFLAAQSQLGHDAPLEYAMSAPLLGLPLLLRSNSPAVIAAAERALGGWRSLDAALTEQAAPLAVDIVVHGPLAAREAESTPTSYAFHGESFIAAGAGYLLSAHTGRGAGLAFVSPALAADEPNLRHSVIMCLALLLASARDRTPIHAGAVVRGGRAALLVGPSMRGKSTLCYACVRAGFSLLAEDVVYVSQAHGLRLWGSPGHIYLLADARRYFPELRAHEPAVQANGKQKLAVALGEGQMQRSTERAIICLLDRRPGQTSTLERLPAAEAVAALAQADEPGFDIYSRQRAAEALAAGGAYRLVMGSELSGAVALLEQVLV
jgi:hypothetical protein